jgi:hypothetical protein
MLANTIFEGAVDKTLDVSQRFGAALDAAGIPYHVNAIDPMAARLTKDVDVAIHRSDLETVRAVVEQYGFKYRHVAGVDMFLDAGAANARSAVHAIFVGEKVRAGDLAETPASDPVRVNEGFLIAPVGDLVCMKLTSYKLKDKVHIQDLDGAGLITPEN